MITCFGTITKDKIRFKGETEIKLGGAPFFFSRVCRELDQEFSIVSKIGQRDFEVNKELLDKPGIQIVDKTTELIINEDADVSCSIVHFAGDIELNQVPEDLFSSEIVLISPLFDEIQPTAFPLGTNIALDLQGFMRDKTRTEFKEGIKQMPKDLIGLLVNVNILKCNEKESEIIFGNIPLQKRLTKFSNMGPSTVIITLGSKGVAAIHNKDLLFLNSEKTVNKHTVGAGDTFFSAFLVMFNKTNSFEESIKFAVSYTTNFLEGKE